jgi:hypothetical protein
MIETVSVHTAQFSHNLWSELIEIISGFSYCRLRNLTYDIDLTWDDVHYDGDGYLVLPGHPQTPYSCACSWFKLLLPGGTFAIAMEGDDVNVRLRDLASYVRAAENRKRQEIISDACVRDSLVGDIEVIGKHR